MGVITWTLAIIVLILLFCTDQEKLAKQLREQYRYQDSVRYVEEIRRERMYQHIRSSVVDTIISVGLSGSTQNRKNESSIATRGAWGIGR